MERSSSPKYSAAAKRRDESRRGGQSVRATSAGKSGAKAPRGLKTRPP